MYREGRSVQFNMDDICCGQYILLEQIIYKSYCKQITDRAAKGTLAQV